MVSIRYRKLGLVIVLLVCALIAAAIISFQYMHMLHFLAASMVEYASVAGHSLAATMVEYAILL